MAKKIGVRIAQEITKPAGVSGPWTETGFFVRVRTMEENEPAVKVASPTEARAVAEKIASEVGGHIYRGSLPHDWISALSDIPRF